MLWLTSKVTTLGYLQRLHCGCIASSSLLELLDCGGVSCINCTKNSGIVPVRLTYILLIHGAVGNNRHMYFWNCIV